MPAPALAPATLARRHTVYYYLLNECLTLSDDHAQTIKFVFGEGADEEAVAALVRSLPTEAGKPFLHHYTNETFDFDLYGVPGFYYDTTSTTSLWKLNLPKDERPGENRYRPRQTQGLLRPYLDERGRITGLFIYRSVRDSAPRLLSSRGLTLGTDTAAPDEYEERALL